MNVLFYTLQKFFDAMSNLTPFKACKSINPAVKEQHEIFSELSNDHK